MLLLKSHDGTLTSLKGQTAIRLQMKSVGEVMGIGRSFQEALHKATQSLELKRNGLGADGKGIY